MPIRSMRITAAVLALAVGMTGGAQAEPFNIFSISKAQEKAEGAPQLEQVRRGGGRGVSRGGYRGGARGVARGGYRGGYYRGGYRRAYPGAAFAVGAAGLAAGAAIASNNYYCDPNYEYCGRSAPYYGGGYYGGTRYYGGRYYSGGRYYGRGAHVRHYNRGGGRVSHRGGGRGRR